MLRQWLTQECTSLLLARILPGNDIILPGAKKCLEERRGTQQRAEVAIIHLKNLLNSQKVSVKPRLMRREVMSGA